MGFQDGTDSQELLVLRACLVCPDRLVSLDHRDLRDLREKLVRAVDLVYLA